MSDFYRSYLTVAFFGGAATVLVGLMLGLGALLRPTRPSEQKYIAYESGVDPVGTGWSQSQIRYYVFALLFVMFDVEAVFIFPWAVKIDALGWFGLVEMVVFIVILAGLLLHEGFPRLLLVGCVISFAGAALIGIATSKHATGAGWGVALCTIAALGYAGGVVAQKPVLRHASPLAVTWLACTVGALSCLHEVHRDP